MNGANTMSPEIIVTEVDLKYTITNGVKPEASENENLTASAVQEAIQAGILYLNESCDPIVGFQNSSIGKTRTDLQPTAHYIEVFTSTLALDLVGNFLSSSNISDLYSFVMPEYRYGSINFNKHEELVPDDVDSTALALAVFLNDGKIENGKQLLDMARLIFLNTNSDGIIETYFPPRGFRVNRVDPATTSNVMRFLYLTGYGMEAVKSEDYLYECLSTGGFLDKCYYYVCPEAFFYFLSSAIVLNKRARARFESLLIQRIGERLGSTGYPLDCAMRILALANLDQLGRDDFKDPIMNEVQGLMAMRLETGAFSEDSLFRLGRSQTFFGGHAISTIFGVAALQAYFKTL